MNEVEVKILAVDVPAIVQKLEELGAKKIFDGDVKAYVFDFPDNRIQKSGRHLRVRTVGDAVELTYKEPIKKENAKHMKEFEIQVTDLETAKNILLGLGLNIVRTVKKQRVSYKLQDAKIEFDTYAKIPTFIEIEAQNEQTVFRYVELLGFSKEDAKPWSGYEVFKYYDQI